MSFRWSRARCKLRPTISIPQAYSLLAFMRARMLRRQLEREGIEGGRRHARTILLRMGIEALYPQPGTSKRNPGQKIYPNLLRKLAIIRANQVWALDTTYCPMATGFVYLNAVGDVASRKCWRRRWRSRWRRAMRLRTSSRPSLATVCRTSSTRTKAVTAGVEIQQVHKLSGGRCASRHSSQWHVPRGNTNTYLLRSQRRC